MLGGYVAFGPGGFFLVLGTFICMLGLLDIVVTGIRR